VAFPAASQLHRSKIFGMKAFIGRYSKMQRTLEELERMVRGKICAVCSDRDGRGGCGLEDPSACALFRLFPQVARAIRSTESDDIRDYVAAIRGQVCSVCWDREPDGSCRTREQVRCALDAYLIPIIGAIEEATGRKLTIDAPRNTLTCIHLDAGAAAHRSALEPR